MHHRRPYRLVQSLTGLRETRTAAVSYQALAPGGAGRSCGISATHTLAQPLTNHHSLITDHCPHTYGVRLSLRGSFATEPCRPTACIPAAPFRHTPYRFRPRQTTTVWRNLPQHLRSGETHTFSAKEKDSETGLSYFGARYYSSDLSIWLSVDPMASKYPSLSPYVYCADNPVKVVDPNGEEYDVFITGEGAEWVTKQLSDSYQGLNITRDKFGRLHTNVDDISSLSEDEKLIYDAINSNTVIVNMLVGETDYVQTSMGNFEINMSAAFGGNVLSDDKSMAFTSQFINKKKVIQNYYSNARGKLIAHELTESYLGGLLSIERQFHASPAEWIKGQDPYYYNDFYRISHDNAISQPYNKSEIRNMFCNTFNCSTLMYDLFIEKRIRP